MVEHIHRELNQEVIAIGGRYRLVKEVCLSFQGRELLYLVGYAAFDSTCCGTGGCAYAVVPGFVLEWKRRSSQEGLAVSEVEPVGDPALQEIIQGLITRKERVQQVRFL